MDFSLSEDQRLLRGEIRRFARKELNDAVIDRDRSQTFSRELWAKCGQMGLPGLPVPQQYGGAGLDSVSTVVALEALGYGCEDGGLVFSLCAHLLACVVPIWKFGTEEQKSRYLPGLCDGTSIAANAMTEPQSGSDAFALRTHARPDGVGYRLNGTKTFTTNGPVADLAVVFALTDAQKGYFGGVTAFLVETDTPGFKACQKFEKMGLRTSPISELVLEDVYVPATATLGGVGGGARVFTHAMDWERACLGATHVGVMERLLEKSIEYARHRRQSGQPIAKFQGVSHKIADMKVRLEAARLTCYRAAWDLEHSKTPALAAAVAKLHISESLVETALNTVQIFGGNGFMTETQVERALRDSVASTLYSGTTEVQKNIIAQWLGV